MKVGIIIYTPAQVHFYKNIIKRLRNDGHDVYVLARGYGETLDLLNELQIPHYSFTKAPVSRLGKAFNLPIDVYRAYRYLKPMNVDVITGYGIVNTITSRLLGATDIVYNDSEPIAAPPSYTMQVRIFKLLTNAIITPSSFRESLGGKQVKVDSFKEMAYLHPDYYRPNDNIYALLGINKSEPYTLLRFNAFDAVHDMGIKGFSPGDKIELVRGLEKYGHVFISAEGSVPEEIKPNVLHTPKNRIHDVIYHAKLLVTDTQTMATEAALLGIPTIRCNSFVGPKDMGNFIELENTYGLMFNYNDPGKAIDKALELAAIKDLAAIWQQKMNKLMSNSVDINDFMAWFIENYPESFRRVKEDPATQNQFRRAGAVKAA